MRKVLIAEDESALLESFKELVEALGCECLEAHDGIEAITLAKSRQPDLVVIDYMMPRCTGVDVIRTLREDPHLCNVPTVLMTAGRPPPSERAEPWLFLPKPVSLEEFERAVQDGLKVAESLRRNGDSLSPRAERLSELSLAREDMLSWVSHEIKSPLAAAVMATQLALRKARGGETGEAIERHLVITRRQLARMDELVSSILDAAQLKDGKLKLEVEPINVAAWLRGIVSFWADLHPDYELSLHDGDGTTMRGDPERLRQIVDNLISNAIKYGRPSKQVRIEVEPGDGHVMIHVQDFGPGIPAEELHNLFDRFHRVAGQGGRGHGLGLYIANALARLHGGELSVRSELGRGSRFTLALPAGRDA
jgi:signal transduction histidine kinase